MRLRHALAPTLGVLAATAAAPALTSVAQAAQPAEAVRAASTAVALPAAVPAAPKAEEAEAARAADGAGIASGLLAAARKAGARAAAPGGAGPARIPVAGNAVGAANAPGVRSASGLHGFGGPADWARTVRTALATGRADRFGPAWRAAPSAHVVPAAFTGTGAALALSGQGPEADRQPSCGKESDPDFPIETRIHGGPHAYRPGGRAGTWNLDLTNTTDEACHNIHPVIVLVDRARALSPARVTLQMSDDDGHWRTLTLEKSDEDETIGVLDDGSPGFAVPAGRTVTVRARLSFDARTRPGTIEVNSATVQRRGDDGDWVGKSNSYRFEVRRPGGKRDGDAERDPGTGRDTAPRTDPPRATGSDAPTDTESRADSGRDRGTDSGRDTGSGIDGGTGTDTGGTDTGGTGTTPRPDAPTGTASAPASTPGPAATGGHGEASTGPGKEPGTVPSAPAHPANPELAATGSHGPLVAGVLAGGLFAAGAGLFLAFRRPGATRP